MAVHAQTNYTLTTKPAKTSLLGGHFIYRVDTTQGTLTPSSANIIQNAADNPQQWGYNTHIGANGIKLRHNEITLSEWKADHLTFYKPGTNNPSLELISGVNTALNIYNPTNNTKTLGLDIDGLNFYGTSISTPDVTLNADGLTLINGSIRGGIVGQDEFLYLSPQVFADEYEEYILSEDTEVNETKTYYIRSGEEGEYIYTEVSEPTGNPQENEYYEIAHAPGTIPIDNYVKDNWRQIIGRKFAVDTDGNLYANGLNANNAHLQQAEVEGAIVATSLTIGSGSDAYDGAAAINISGYDIEIEKNGIDEVEGVSVYLYPILYHNGVQVPTIEVDYSHFIWYQDDNTIGTEGDGNNSGRYLATYGHNYRVIYDFDDGAVGGGTEVVDRTIDPSKYITKISDTGITIHPEVWTNQSSYIQLNGSGMELFDNNGNSIAQYGDSIRIGKSTENHLEINNSGLNILNNTNSLANFGNTARIGLNNSSRFLMNNNSLEAYDNNNNKYFEVNSSGLSWGNNIAATTADLANKATISYVLSIDTVVDVLKTYYIRSGNVENYIYTIVDNPVGNPHENNYYERQDIIDAAKTATNFISVIDEGGIKIHEKNSENTNYAKINSNGMSIFKNGNNIAEFGNVVRVGIDEDGYSRVLIDPTVSSEGISNIFRIMGSAPALNYSLPIYNTIFDDDRWVEREIVKQYQAGAYGINDRTDIEPWSSNVGKTKTLGTSTFILEDIDDINNNETFTFEILIKGLITWGEGEVSRDLTSECSLSFIKQTDDTTQTVSDSFTLEQSEGIVSFNVTGLYAPNTNSITLSGTVTYLQTNHTYEWSIMKIYINTLNYSSGRTLVPIHQFGGDLYTCVQPNMSNGEYDANGRFYVGIDRFNSVQDFDLYTTMQKLEWLQNSSLLDLKDLLNKTLNKILVLSSVDETYKEILVGDYTNRAKDIESSLNSSDADRLWIMYTIKAICQDYPNYQNTIFKGRLVPNSQGYFEVFIYNTSDLLNGHPRYCHGTWRKWSSVFGIFYRQDSDNFIYTAK